MQSVCPCVYIYCLLVSTCFKRVVQSKLWTGWLDCQPDQLDYYYFSCLFLGASVRVQTGWLICWLVNKFICLG